MEFRNRLFTTITELMRRPDHESVLMVSHGAACAQFPRAFGVELTEGSVGGSATAGYSSTSSMATLGSSCSTRSIRTSSGSQGGD